MYFRFKQSYSHSVNFVIMHPLRGPKGRGVADRQRGWCISILRGFVYLNRVPIATMVTMVNMVTMVTTITTVNMVTIVHRVTIVTMNSLVILVFMFGIVKIVFCMYS